MDLKQLQTHWDEWGKRDPLWAILSDHGDRSVDDFFARGRDEVSLRLAQLQAAGIHTQRRRVLDFGCGMGRLTQAFCDHFNECVGVDIAPSMIDLALSHNRHGDRCRYHLNPGNDLSLFPDRSFDLVYTMLVLQHMRPRYAMNYIGEFLRLLSPGGAAMFQIPGEVIQAGDGVAPVRPPSSPLPPDARRVELAFINLPANRPAGLQFQLRVMVKNTGDAVWPAARTTDGLNQLVVTNRWLSPSGDVVEENDGRSLLPRDLQPGEEAEVIVLITPPQQSGQYKLEVSMLEDGVGRFGPAIASVQITEVPIGASGPAIQMFGVGKHTIARLVQESGLRLVDVSDNQAAGPYWTSSFYCVSRQAVGN